MTPSIVANSLALAFTLFGGACVFAVLAGLPGTWILIISAMMIDCLDWLWLPAGSSFTFHPLTIIAVIIMATIGELLEFALSAAGARKFGASPRGMIGSMIGGVIGALVGTVLILIPLVGTLTGAVIGTAMGAMLGELTHEGRKLHETAKPALGAVIGRILGTLAKLPISLAVWMTLAIAAFTA
jgi:uncharacterized protein YqgC (DUF456 family)